MSFWYFFVFGIEHFDCRIPVRNRYIVLLKTLARTSGFGAAKCVLTVRVKAGVRSGSLWGTAFLLQILA